MTKIKNGQLVFLTTFSIFTLEAMFHYNYGKGGKKEGEGLDFHLPEKKDWLRIIATVAVFSYLNAKLLNYLREN